MQVYSLSQKRLIEVPDDPMATPQQSAPVTTTPDTMSMADGTPPVASMQTPAVTTPEAPKTITGRTIEEHAQALQAANAAGDTAAAKQIKAAYDMEYKFQTDTGMLGKSDKKKDGDAAVVGLMNTLEELKKDSEEVGLADIPGGIIGTNSKRTQFETKRALAAQFLAKAVENGRLSDADRTFYQKIVSISPDGFQDPKNQQIDNLIDTVSTLTGVKRTSPVSEEKGLGIGKALKGAGEWAFGTAKNVAQDINAGVIANMTEDQRNAANTQLKATADSLINESLQQKDPEKRRELYDQAMEIYGNISASEGEVAKTFSTDINKSVAERSLGAAAQIAGGAELLANPAMIGNMVKAPFQALRHLVQTVKDASGTVKAVTKDPVGVAKDFIKNDYADTNFFGKQLPGAKNLGAEGYGTKGAVGAVQQAVPETVPQPVTQPAAEVSEVAPTLSAEELSVRDKLAKNFSTSVAIPDENDVVRSEKIMQDAFRMTKENDPRGMARELKEDVGRAGDIIKTHVQNLDQKLGMQPLQTNEGDGILDLIMSEVNKSTAARANPQLVDKLRGELQGLLKGEGAISEEALARGVTEGTNFAKMDEARMYLTNGKNSWFSRGQPVGNPTDDLNSLDWAAANAIKKIMGEADEAGIFKQMLARQHTALEAYPVISKAVLSGGTKVTSPTTALRRGFEEVRDRVGLRSVERNTNRLPEITLADGSSPVSGESAVLQNAAPMTAKNTPLEGAGDTKPQFTTLTRDKRMKPENPEAFREKGSKKNEIVAEEPQVLERLKYDPDRLEKRILNPNTFGNPGTGYEVQIRYKGFAADKKSFPTKKEAEEFLKNYEFKGMNSSVAEDYGGTSFDPFPRNKQKKGLSIDDAVKPKRRAN